VPLGAILVCSPSAIWAADRGLEVGAFELLAEGVAAAVRFEGIGGELTLAEEGRGEAHGFEGGGAVAEGEEGGVVGEDSAAAWAAADALARLEYEKTLA